MSDGNLRQRQSAPCPVMNRFSFRKPPVFKITFYVCHICKSFRTQFKKSGTFHHPVDRIAVIFIITGKVKYCTFFQHPVQLGGEITAEQTVFAVAVFGPRIGAEQMDAVERTIRDHKSDQMAGFDTQYFQIFNVVVIASPDDFAQPAEHHIGTEDVPFRIVCRQRDRKTAGTAAEVKFAYLILRQNEPFIRSGKYPDLCILFMGHQIASRLLIHSRMARSTASRSESMAEA